MLLTILIILKTLVYINITNILYNEFTILFFTSLVSGIIISLIEFSKIKDKHKKISQITFYTLFSLIIFADVMYYSYFQSLPSVSVLGQASQLSSVVDMILILLSVKNLLMIVDLPLTIYYVLRKQSKKQYNKATKQKTIAGLIGAFIVLNIMVIITNKQPALLNQEIFAYHVSDIVNTYFKDESLAREELDTLREIRERAKKDLEREDKKFQGIGKDKNLIVIQVESLQNFVVNLNYNGQEVTPYINSLIKEDGSLYFDEYFQLTGRGNTSDAEFVTNNSLHPSMEEYTYSQYADNDFYGLPWLLGDQGYSAWVFHGYEKEFWNREKAYPNQGFERFISEEDYDFEEVIGFGISDKDFYEQSLEYMKELDEIDDNPFYVFLVSLSSHTPYTMDSKYHVLDIKEEHRGNIVGDYLQAIHYADQELGRFIESLKEEGLYEDSIIAFYGDHYGVANSMPEVFGPMEDILGEAYNFDHVMNIPLVIHMPGEEVNERISKVGSQIDFYPTILNIMGYKNEKGLMMGQDLINSREYNFVPTQTIMRKGSFIDKDIIFQISQDGIFEHSRATDRKTREKLDVNKYRDKYDKAIAEINLSDLILKENILKEVGMSGGAIEDISIGSSSSYLPQEKTIKIYDEYSIEDLSNSYEKGERIIGVKIDDDVDLEELEAWMMEDEDVYLILKTRGKNIELLERIKDEYKDLRDRYMAVIDDTEDHFPIQRHGYRNIIFEVKEDKYTDREIIDFLNLHNHYGVILDESRKNESLLKKLEELGVKIYIKDLENKKLQAYD